MGAAPDKIDVTVDEKRTSRTYWMLPADLLETGGTDEGDEDERVAA